MRFCSLPSSSCFIPLFTYCFIILLDAFLLSFSVYFWSPFVRSAFSLFSPLPSLRLSVIIFQSYSPLLSVPRPASLSLHNPYRVRPSPSLQGVTRPTPGREELPPGPGGRASSEPSITVAVNSAMKVFEGELLQLSDAKSICALSPESQFISGAKWLTAAGALFS